MIIPVGGDIGGTHFLVDIITVNAVNPLLESMRNDLLKHMLETIKFAVFMAAHGHPGVYQSHIVADTKNLLLEGWRDGNSEQHFGLRNEYKTKYLHKISSVINGVMSRASTELVYGIQDNLIEVEDNLIKTTELIRCGERALQNENARVKKNLDAITNSISEISELTDGTQLTISAIRKMAVH